MRSFVVSALVLALFAGCSPYVNRGETLYREGRYIEAAEVFELTEAKLKRSSSEICAEYGLYRGLTYLKLDDLRNAHLWLTYAYNVEQRSPGQLTAEEHVLLERGWRELGQRTRSRGPEEPTQVAAADPKAAQLSAGTTPNGRRAINAE